SSLNICLHPFNLLYSYELCLVEVRERSGQSLLQWTEYCNIKRLEIRSGKRNSILKAVSYKASTNMAIVTIADEEALLTIRFCSCRRLEDAF
ncbi:hypothetical protein LIPSTDRAFT_31930, partial [Lipomyces starkeyi NRRL Y-11557]